MNKILVEVQCRFCHTIHTIQVGREEWEKYTRGEGRVGQNLFTEIKPEVREMFISGVCPSCTEGS